MNNEWTKHPLIKCKNCDEEFTQYHSRHYFCSKRCKEVQKVKRGYFKEFWQKNRERLLPIAKIRNSKPKAKSYRIKAVLKYQAKNPEKIAAHRAVKNAIKQGILVNPHKCSYQDCTASGRMHAHHHLGYEPINYLNVIFLCPRHHKQAHAHIVA